MPGILLAANLIQTALGVIGSFNGSPQLAKTTGYVQDAVKVVTALTPLVQGFANGQDVTPDDVRGALLTEGASLDAFDAEIAQKSELHAPGT